MSRQDDIMSHMSIITVEQLKEKFESGDNPRSSDYIDMIDTLAALPDGIHGKDRLASAEIRANPDSNPTIVIRFFFLETENPTGRSVVGRPT
jgi:hypothetical protein